MFLLHKRTGSQPPKPSQCTPHRHRSCPISSKGCTLLDSRRSRPVGCSSNAGTAQVLWFAIYIFMELEWFGQRPAASRHNCVSWTDWWRTCLQIRRSMIIHSNPRKPIGTCGTKMKLSKSARYISELLISQLPWDHKIYIFWGFNPYSEG